MHKVTGASFLNIEQTGGDRDVGFGDDDDEVQSADKRNWVGPAEASMARLNSIKTNVYNLNLHNASSIKPPRNLRAQTRRQSSTDIKPSNPQDLSITGAGMISPSSQAFLTNGKEKEIRKEMKSFRDLPATPPLSTRSYQVTAWANHSPVSEFVSRHGKRTRPNRPVSAQVHSSTRLVSKMKARPQSAKDSVKPEQDASHLGIHGHKKDIESGLPPHHPGYIPPSPHTGQMTDPRVTGQAWATLPPGHSVNPHYPGTANQTTDPPQQLLVPFSSPRDDQSDEEDRDQVPSSPPLLRRPIQQPIHLSLPTMEDDPDRTKESLDTDRLLKQADAVLTKKESEQKVNLDSINATLPECLENGSSSDEDCLVQETEPNGIKQDQTIDSRIWKKTLRELSNEENNEGGLAGGLGPIRSDQPKRKFLDSKVGQSHSSIHEIDQSYEPLKVKSNFHKLSGSQSVVNESMQTRNTEKKSGVSIREDRNITVDITPRNLGRKVEPASLSNKNSSVFREKKLTQIIDHTGCGCEDELKRMGQAECDGNNLVSMVTVEYENTEMEKETKKRRKRRSMKEVETMMSRLLMSDDEEPMEAKPSTLHKSKGEQNYYERSRSGSSFHPSGTESKGDSLLVKTTKTIEFNTDTPQEVVTKNPFAAPYDERKEGVTQHQSIPLWPSTIKKQQERTKKIVAEKQTGVAEKQTGVAEKQTGVAEKQTGVAEKQTGVAEKQTGVAEKQTGVVEKQTKAREEGKTPQEQYHNDETLKKSEELELLLGQAIDMAKESFVQAEVKVRAKPRPYSAGVRCASLTDIKKSKDGLRSDPVSKAKVTGGYSSYSVPTKRPRVKSAGYRERRPPLILKTVKVENEVDTREQEECREMQSKMAALGLDIDPRVLERALYAPSGKSIYYDVPGDLPRNPTDGLLLHYKHWLSEDYRRLQTINRRLAQDDQVRYLQKLSAERKAKKLAAKNKKKTSKGSRKKGSGHSSTHLSDQCPVEALTETSGQHTDSASFQQVDHSLCQVDV